MRVLGFRFEGEAVVADLSVENFTLDGLAIGMRNRPGRGHWHAYLDGVLTEIDDGTRLVLHGLQPGVHHLRLSLRNNDHSPVHPPVGHDVSLEVL